MGNEVKRSAKKVFGLCKRWVAGCEFAKEDFEAKDEILNFVLTGNSEFSEISIILKILIEFRSPKCSRPSAVWGAG